MIDIVRLDVMPVDACRRQFPLLARPKLARFAFTRHGATGNVVEFSRFFL
jgi:hypothetical protein